MDNNPFYPFHYDHDEQDESGWEKGPERYDVYVNNDFVGIKPLFAQNDRIQDLSDFINEQGISAFQASIDEGNYLIHTDEQFDQLKEVLTIYLQSR
ncbi:hypothetical protein EV207_1476 [Scopulibacillus darangshiensis]|uniref:Uncharacterized protein n=1 Tax=Scopulibacillus darangshiensis TaxID=442528 RepID=A0A4V2SKV0_9BACL|nr:hypothetical protein [Scopulibacillus darangshiensis]TCP20956.1 hypothetical protein EV207_1476 [Scopulibacillus darangshiensis]